MSKFTVLEIPHRDGPEHATYRILEPIERKNLYVAFHSDTVYTTEDEVNTVVKALNLDHWDREMGQTHG